MEITEITINGEVYTVTKTDTGHIIKELKMTDAQKAILDTMYLEPSLQSAKVKAARAALKETQIANINNVPGLRDAVKLLLDAVGIEYKT